MKREFSKCIRRCLAQFLFARVILCVALAPESVLAQGSQNLGQIHIGISLPLTGDLKEYGHAVAHGIELARENFPERFKKLRLSFEDNKYEATPALEVFRKFQFGKVDLMYSWGEPPLHAIAPIAEHERIPLVAVSLDSKPARGKKYVVRSINSPKEMIAPVLAYLRSRGLKRIGVIKADDPYDNAYVAALQDSVSEDEKVSILSSVLPEEADFRGHAIRARRAQIDVLGLFVYPSQVGMLYRSMTTLGYKPASFGTDVFESERVIAAAGPAIEGAVYANMAMPGWFAKEYVAKVGNDDQIAYAFNGYAWAAITAEVLSKVMHRPSADEIVQLLTSVTGREGGLEFQYRDTPEGGRYWEFPVLLKVVENGSFRLVQ